MTDRQTPSAELAARVGVMMADDVEARDIVLGLAINAPSRRTTRSRRSLAT
ncbi:hypothetical protein GS502_31455 [Rhodococcus hoagii]|nr:hypothetical protein [Prescottella equi]